MLGTVIKGAYKGSSLHRAENSKALYLQTPSGEKIGVNKNTAISAKNVADTSEYNGQKAMCITWLNGETSIVVLGAKPQTNTVPAFTPPAPAVPTFAPPTQAAPVFEPPKAEIPTFVPPTNAAPTFTPPAAPKFSPPARPAFNGPACHFHPDEPAVKRCARCRKPICRDCVENYQVTNDEYAGKPLCYDCCQELVSENIATLTANLNKIKFQFGLSIVGIVIGFLFGLIAGLSAGDFGAGLMAGLIYGCVGGVFLSAMKAFFSLLWDAIKIAFAGQFGWLTILSIIVQIFIIMIKCVFVTISNTIHYIIYIKKTNGFIESDTAFLQQIKDYMEYTLVRNKYEGVDIETLLAQESRLADNSFAQMVREKGEDQAEAHLRGVTATINEHGEIIRSFAA